MSWTAHLPILPVLLPAATAVALLALGDARRRASRSLSLSSTALGLLLALALLRQADGGALLVYRLGDWPAPFGIALVADRLSALMVLLTSAVALPVVLYAATAGAPAWDARGRHFHALFQFQLMGLNGAFVTGDLFNLFVFFEVLLIASYVLMLHGLGRERLRAGLHYVVLNLAASALFLLGLALVYAAAGTLNLADLALRAPQVAGTDARLLQAGALLLLVVFAFKAALVPLSLWLPATYSAAGAPVAALFALMTKVGVYAIWRVHGVAFGAGADGASGASGAHALAQPLLLPLALLSCLLGVAGAMAARTLARLVAWLNVASVGTVLAGLGLHGAAAWGAALFYLPGSTLVVALLFLLADVVGQRRGEAGDALEPVPAVRQPAWLGGLFLLGAVSIAGLPPLPGFLGKVLLLQAAAGHPAAAAVWAVLLLMGSGALIALARAGSVLFWQAQEPPAPARPSPPFPLPGAALAAVLLLAAAGVALSVAAAPVQRYARAAAEQLVDVAGYAQAVLPQAGGAQPHSTRPYTGRVEGAQP
ncbi:monovalent cation/H+ antiporter subunit D [Azohydromonas lata]|uniref:monovalent cation/H+ antiporter subunit D n=1 Tax=Azohydromonas lata TaxID=45677 RepID=UPI0008379C9C|nr:monovalent cation/H+ antiporter subunit D [Azohydromonas lata]